MEDLVFSPKVHFNATTYFLCDLGQTIFFLILSFVTSKQVFFFPQGSMCTYVQNNLKNDKALLHNSFENTEKHQMCIEKRLKDITTKIYH